jgi:hypothetical protein
MKFLCLICSIVMFSTSASAVYARTYDVTITNQGFSPSSLTVVTLDIARISNQTENVVTLTTIPISSGSQSSFDIGVINPLTQVETTFNTPGVHLLSTKEFPSFSSTITILERPSPHTASDSAATSDSVSPTLINVNAATDSAAGVSDNTTPVMINETVEVETASTPSSGLLSPAQIGYLLASDIPIISLSLVAVVASLVLAIVKTKHLHAPTGWKLKDLAKPPTSQPRPESLSKLERISHNLEAWTKTVRTKSMLKKPSPKIPPHKNPAKKP